MVVETNTKAAKEVEIGEAAMTTGVTMAATVEATAVAIGMTPSKVAGVETVVEEEVAKVAGDPTMGVTAAEAATWETTEATAAMAAVAIGTTPSKAAGVDKAEEAKAAGDPIMGATAAEATWETMVDTAAVTLVATGTTPNKEVGVVKEEVVKVAGDRIMVVTAARVATIKAMVADP